MNEALRSSWCTCSRMPGSAASASAMGVDRDPGLSTASVNPQRTHSSTSVAQYVAATSPSDGAAGAGSDASAGSWGSRGRGSGCMGRVSLRCATVSAEATTLAPTGTTLAATVRGDGPNVTLVHGFAQNRACLGPLAEAIAARGRTVLPDAPGHGGSQRHSDADVRRGAERAAPAGGPGVFLGYSMGGRRCLRAALDHPGTVQALVLIGATAGIEADAERRARQASDVALAERLEQIGVTQFVAEWLSLPLFAGLPDWARFDAERRTNSAAGLAASLRHAGTGSMEPLWDRLGELAVPVLCLTGSLDVRFGEVAARIVERIGRHARHEVIDGAGHAAHLERPDAVIDVVSTFLDDLPAPA